MALITIVLAGYIFLGWSSLAILARKEGKDEMARYFRGVEFTGLLLVAVYFIAKWLEVDLELFFLFAVGIGSMAYISKLGAGFEISIITATDVFAPKRLWLFFFYSVGYILLLGAVGYHWYIAGFLPTLYLFLLGSVASIIVYIPLIKMPMLSDKETFFTSFNKAQIFMVIAFGNILLRIFFYGV
ncbi:hypothetical protein COT82_01810 [Candidatus Campbellbacteria bacterium CG10_big_fil_rev_8_21_14_0_10_35_52]|uniref:Uncharacterized protein n=1 Tax=Candidatus Campbellbacteria bacterium CG10_big_fil_rev_8_21_14_0_10_35_52 TaxID=1974527 RepID=A0A2M6WVC6_9BACT|nr:MAG: hypothetical protein COT82_01810 [Candidatus Campbellbacteria bacterium CG10_big_fil_rev_8_21_14_0_10_35_52]